MNDLGAIGIRAKVQPLERAAMPRRPAREKGEKPDPDGQRRPRERGHADRSVYATVKGSCRSSRTPRSISGSSSSPRERDRKKREELLHKIQQKVYDEAYFLPIWQLGFLCVTGPRVAVSGLGLIPGYIYSAPYEDVRLKS